MPSDPGFSWLSLGGVGEIGKNCYVIEIENKIIVIDVGMSFPDLRMFGVDIVIPDFSYLVKNQHKIVGIVLTHGHEDHIGSLSYLLEDLRTAPPIYGAKFTLGLLRPKLAEVGLGDTPLFEFKPGDLINVAGINIQTIRVTHSIPDACSLAIETPCGIYLHSGDIKIDPQPIDGHLTDLALLEDIGLRGVTFVTIDTTNVERPGNSGSESEIMPNLLRYVKAHDGRVFVTTFASNIHRLQSAINVAVETGRKVLVLGRTMVNNVQMSQDMGYLQVPPGVLVDPHTADTIPDEELLVLVTGSQGEPLAAMSRIANGDHRFITMRETDLFLFSARPIPGNEVPIFGVIDDLFRAGADVVYGMDAHIHVSGHGYQDELKQYLDLAKPKYVIPYHGEYRMQMRFHKLAPSWGIPESNVMMAEIGQKWECREEGFRLLERVKSGEIYITGKGNSDLSRKVINERLALAEDGVLIFSVALSSDGENLLAPPQLIGKGFLPQKDFPELFEEMQAAITEAVYRNRQREPQFVLQLRNNIQNVIQRIIFKKTKINPVVIGMVTYEDEEGKRGQEV